MIPGGAFGGPRAAPGTPGPKTGPPRPTTPSQAGHPGLLVMRAFGPPDHVNNGVKRRFALVASRGVP